MAGPLAGLAGIELFPESTMALAGREHIGYRFELLDLHAVHVMMPQFLSYKAFAALTAHAECLNLPLSAFTGLEGAGVVLLTGVVITNTSAELVEGQIPPDLGSPLEAAAWVSYILGSDRRKLEPLPDWFVEGEGHWDLIPHVRERREYEARPKCYIERDYARPLRRKLLEELSYPTGEAEMTFSFDGGVLSIVHRNNVHRVVAAGDNWPCSYRVTVAPEAKLPTRFNRPTVEVSVFKGYVLFDERYFWPCEPVD